MADHPANQTEKPPAHGCRAKTDPDREVPEIDLLSPLTSHGVAFPNLHEIRTMEHLHDYSA